MSSTVRGSYRIAFYISMAAVYSYDNPKPVTNHLPLPPEIRAEPSRIQAYGQRRVRPYLGW